MSVARSTGSPDILLFLIVVPVFAFLDVLVALAFPDSYRVWNFLPALLAGLVTGQWSLIAAWSVFGPSRWFVRWPALLALAASLYVIFVTTAALSEQNERLLTDGYTAGLFLPLFMLSTQPGMWIVKFATGWQIAESSDAMLGNLRRVQFTLAHLLTAMTIIASAFGLAQLELSIHMAADRESGLLRPGGNEQLYWILVLTLALPFSIYGALVVTPLFWSIMRPGNPVRRIALVVGCLTIATLGLFGFLTVAALVTSMGLFGITFFPNMLVALAVFHVGFAIVFVGTLLLARVFDFRLYSARHFPSIETQPKTID